MMGQKDSSVSLKRQFTYPPLAPPSRSEFRSCRCSFEEFFAVCCIGVGIVGIAAGFLEFAALDVPPWRQFYVPLSFFVGSSFIFWQGIGKKNHGLSNLLLPVSMFFLGNSLGFALCWVWNRDAADQKVFLRHDLGKLSGAFVNGIPKYSQELTLFGFMGLQTFVLALIQEAALCKRKHSSCRTLFRSTLHLVVVGGSLIFTTSMAVLFADPEKAPESQFGRWTVSSPPIAWQQLLLLSGLQLLAAATCFVSLLFRFKGRWISNLCFVIVFLLHVAVVVLSAVSVSLTPWWLDFQNTTTWVLFASSCVVLVLSLLTNVSYGSMRKNSKAEELPMLAPHYHDLDETSTSRGGYSPSKRATPSMSNSTPHTQGLLPSVGSVSSCHPPPMATMPSYVPSASQLPSGVIFIHPPTQQNPSPTAYCITPR